MLASEIHFTHAWETDRLDGLQITAVAAARWPRPGRARRPSLAAVGGALLLHIAAFGLALAFVQVRPQPFPPEDLTVTVVFEQPEAPPAVAPDSVAPPAEAALEPRRPPEAIAPPPAPAPPVAELARPPAEPLPPEEKAVEAPAPVAPPPVVHKPVARAKPAAAGRVAAPPAPTAAEVPQIPAPAQPVAAQPISPDWERSLAAWMAAHKVYPELARRRGVEGSAVLRFTADRSGRVLNVSLMRSAGSPLLDAAAEALVRDATLPPFPPAMPQAVATVNVTVRYALTN